MTATTPAPTQDQPPLEGVREYQTRIPVADIEPHLRNVRFDVDTASAAFAELVESIRHMGVISPLTLAPSLHDGACPTCVYVHHLDADGRLVTHDKNTGRARKICDGSGNAPTSTRTRWVIIAGHRRHAAAKTAGIPDVPAIVRLDLTTAADVTMAMLAENLHREDLTAVEEAAAYEQLQLAGIKAPEIAARTGRAVKTVRSRLGLMGLPEATRQLVHGHQITLDVAERMSRFASDQAAMNQLTTAAPDDLGYKLRELERRREHAKALAKVEKALTAAGVSVVATEPPWQFRLKNLDLDQEEHASCPHHVAFIEDWGAASFFCAKPTTHPDVKIRESRPDTNTKSAETVAFEEAVAISADLRAAFIRPFISGEQQLTRDQELVVLKLAATCILSGSLGNLNAQRLLILGDLGMKKSSRTGEIREAASRKFAKSPVRAVLLALAVEWDPADTWGWSNHNIRQGTNGRAWLDLIQQFGYRLSTWETGRLEAIDAKSAAAGTTQDG